jgi:hypothetical protein
MNKKLRPSPNQHASETRPGTVLVGNNKKKWICKVMPNKVRRWVPLADPKSAKGYLIHHNGGRPYKVCIEKTIISVYERDGRSESYSKNVYQIKKPLKVFLGEYKGKKYKYSKKDLGNSVLVQVAKDKFVFIGDKIFSFKITDQFVSFHSPIGNSDVPCPWLVGSEKTYLLGENTWLENSAIKTKDDPYADLYSLQSVSKKRKSLPGYKIVKLAH